MLSPKSGIGEQVCGIEDSLCRIGRSSAHEVVAAVGQLVQVNVLCQQLPVAVPVGERRGDRVVGGNDYRDRRRQFDHRRAFQSGGEIVVGRQAVVPVGGSD